MSVGRRLSILWISKILLLTYFYMFPSNFLYILFPNFTQTFSITCPNIYMQFNLSGRVYHFTHVSLLSCCNCWRVVSVKDLLILLRQERRGSLRA
jgi:hypothetical protein